MPAPHWLARFNKHATNRVLGPFAERLPGFGIVVHTGRKTQRQYRTPIMLFPHADGYVIALTYGPQSQWVRNVLASGGCTLETRGRLVPLTQPRLVHDKQRQLVPAPIRVALRLLRVADFLVLSSDVAMTGDDRIVVSGPVLPRL